MVSFKQMRNLARGSEEDVKAFLDPRHRSETGFVPSFDDVKRWLEDCQREIDYLMGSMEEPSMVSMAVISERPIRDFESIRLNEQGYDYVNARIKSAETPERERNDLRKVRRVYQIVRDVREAKAALENSDVTKLNRILNRRKGVSA